MVRTTLEDGRLGAPWDGTKAVMCTHVFDGEKVAVYMGHLARPRAVYGTVWCAAGNHARVELPDGSLVWRHVNDLARVSREVQDLPGYSYGAGE